MQNVLFLKPYKHDFAFSDHQTTNTIIPNDPVSVLVICLGELGCKNPVDDDAGEGEDWGYAVSSSADRIGKIGIIRFRDSGTQLSGFFFNKGTAAAVAAKSTGL